VRCNNLYPGFGVLPWFLNRKKIENFGRGPKTLFDPDVNFTFSLSVFSKASKLEG